LSPGMVTGCRPWSCIFLISAKIPFLEVMPWLAIPSVSSSTDWTCAFSPPWVRQTCSIPAQIDRNDRWYCWKIWIAGSAQRAIRKEK
jgi:hypothetical protein